MKRTLRQMLLMAFAYTLANSAAAQPTTEHLEVDASTHRGAQDAVSSLETGQLDVDMSAVNAGFFNAANQDLDLRIVASPGVQPLPATATPPIESAIPAESFATLAIRQNIRQNIAALVTPDGGAGGGDITTVSDILYATPIPMERMVDAGLVHKAAASLN